MQRLHLPLLALLVVSIQHKLCTAISLLLVLIFLVNIESSIFIKFILLNAILVFLPSVQV